MKNFKVKYPKKNMTVDEWVGVKDEPMKKITILIPEDMRTSFDIKCTKNGRTMSNVLREFIQEYVKQ